MNINNQKSLNLLKEKALKADFNVPILVVQKLINKKEVSPINSQPKNNIIKLPEVTKNTMLKTNKHKNKTRSVTIRNDDFKNRTIKEFNITQRAFLNETVRADQMNITGRSFNHSIRADHFNHTARSLNKTIRADIKNFTRRSLNETIRADQMNITGRSLNNTIREDMHNHTIQSFKINQRGFDEIKNKTRLFNRSNITNIDIVKRNANDTIRI